MSRYKALLTDLDGTLIHSQDCICDALAAAFEKTGVRVPAKEEIMGMFGLPVEEMLTALTEVRKKDRERIETFVEEYKRQYPIHMERAGLIANAKETLRAVYSLGCPICLITSERAQNAAHILERLGLDQYIRRMVTRDDVVHFKPNPEPILKGAQACGFEPGECVYIGESPFDIEAGVAAKVYTVAVPSGSWSRESLEEKKPDCLIEDISRLEELFH